MEFEALVPGAYVDDRTELEALAPGAYQYDRMEFEALGPGAYVDNLSSMLPFLLCSCVLLDQPPTLWWLITW